MPSIRSEAGSGIGVAKKLSDPPPVEVLVINVSMPDVETAVDNGGIVLATLTSKFTAIGL